MTAAPMVYAAIAAVMAELAKVGIGKDAVNAHDGYKYRSIDAVLNALSPALATHGLVIMPTVIAKEVAERESKSGATLLHVTLTLRYSFVAVADGSRHEIEVLGEASDRADKAINKAMAAGFKYAVTQVFCIGYQGMSDADASSEGAASSAGERTAHFGEADAADGRGRRQYRGRFPQRARRAAAGNQASAQQADVQADALAADLADAIDDASTTARLDELVPSLQTLPADLRGPLRRRFADRRVQLRDLERDRVGLDELDTAGNPSAATSVAAANSKESP